MSPLFLFRLALDFLAVSLLLAAYAYNWLGNAAHEVIGTVMFALLIAHNIFNRRWYGTIAKRRREARGTISKVINLSLLVTMLSLLVTSVIISQTVFSFLPVGHQLHRASGPHSGRLWGAADCRPASGPAVVDDHGPGAKQAGDQSQQQTARLGSARSGALHRCLWCSQPAWR